MGYLGDYDQFADRVCDGWSFVGPGEAGLSYIRCNCKSLRCPRCGKKRLNAYRDGVAKAARELGLSRFVTLTLDPARIPEGTDSVAYIRETWRKFRVTLKRHYPGFKSFVSVIELHESGVAHLHCLVGLYISQAWLSDAWYSVGGGQVVDIRYRDIHRITPYITKYLTKELLLSCPPGKKRITTSRDISLIPKREKQGFALLQVPIEWEMMRYMDMESRYGLGLVVNIVKNKDPNFGNELYAFDVLETGFAWPRKESDAN